MEALKTQPAVSDNPIDLITDNLDIWTSAIQTRSTAGRGRSKKLNLYGIKKLRELILELAVRGKLVPQDPNDEPASVLLERIVVEKARLVKEKKIKKPKLLPEITEGEKPNFLPAEWEVARLGDVMNVLNGRAYKKHEMLQQGTPLLRVGNLFTSNEWYYSDLNLEPEKYIDTGDLIYAWSASFGPFIWDGGKVIYHYHIWKLDLYHKQSLCKHYLYNYLLAATKSIKASGNGIAMIHMTKERMEKLVLPVPPLDEQHRIVAKVDELMTLCDQLEQQTEASIAAHATLVETLLATLTNSADAAELEQNWTRIADHFDTLFITDHSIDQLKQTVLQLAVMGKLVPQDPNDESAAVLLEKIAAEKVQLVKEKKIKKQKALPPIGEDEKPFALPEGWGFSHMQDLCSLITDGTHQTPKYADTGRPFVSAQCVKPFRFMPTMCRYVSEEHYQGYIKNRKPEYRDILLARVGAGIGEAALIDTDLEFAIYVSTGLLKPHKAAVLPEYMVVWLNSPVGRHSSEKNTYGKGVSQGNLNLSLIRSFVVSLPPYMEQQRIVAKVDQLMTLCDQLKSRLQQAQQTQLHLADALVEQAVG